jgi:hypothetical protein
MSIKIAFLQYKIQDDSFKMNIGDETVNLPYGGTINNYKWQAINNAKGANITLGQYARIKEILNE